MKKLLSTHKQITADTKWSEVNDILRRNEIWEGLDEIDRLKYRLNQDILFSSIFTEFVLDLDRKERDDKRRTKRLQERKNREAFRELLAEKIETGKLNHKAKWRAFLNNIKDDPRLLNMLGQQGSTPRELFEDKIEFLKD